MTDLSGTLEGVGLPAVVRFLSGLNKTGCLRITHQDLVGEVFFQSGRVVSARLGSRYGLSALDALVQVLPGGTFAFETGVEPSAEGNIDLSPDALQTHLDDLVERTSSGGPSLPSLDAIPHVAPPDQSPAEDSVPLDRGALQTLLTVDGKRSVREIIAQRGTFDALWQLAHLAETGLVRITRPQEPTRPSDAVEPERITPEAAAVSEPERVATPPTKPQEPAQPHEPAQPTSASAAMHAPADVAPTLIDQPAAGAPTVVGQPVASDLSHGPVHCPKLGFEDDPSSSFGRPTRLHRCFAGATPLSLSLDQQRELCLTDQFATCPRLLSAADQAEPAAPASATGDARRTGAGAPRASAPAADSVTTPGAPPDPRIVRLPLGTRNGGGPRTPSDLPAVGSAEPSRLRPVAPDPREGGAPTRPTPLRARHLRPTPTGVAEPAEASQPPRMLDDVGVSTSAAADGATPRRRVPSALPVPLLAAGGVLVVVVALVAVLVGPNLGGQLDPSELESGAPSSPTVAVATPPSQITLSRATASAARPPAAPGSSTTTETQPRTDAQPTAPAPRPTVAPTIAPEPPAAVAAGPRVLLEETFADNARGWVNNPQGVAAVAGGEYRILPRQSGQFVAIGAPIPDIVRDVVVSATFRKVGGPAGGGFGIIVRDQGPGPRDGVNQVGRYYVLEVGDKGEVGMWRRDGERWIDLLPWQRSDAVRPGTAVNEMTVRAIGDRLSLTVNGSEVASHTDAALPVGGVGAFVGGDGNQIALEQFSVQVP